MSAERDLLFGLLALQNGLIGQGALVAAFQAWTRDKARPLADHLVVGGELDADDRSAVEALVARHLKKHGGSTAKSLAALPAGRSLQRSLAGLDDPELAASIAGLPIGDDSALTVAEGAVIDGGRVLARLGADLGTTSPVVLPDNDQKVRPPDSRDGHGDRLIPVRAGRYRLLDEIARGGMGAVYRGRDVELGRDLALKLLLEQHRDRVDLIERFVEEAQICGQLQHPGIVPVYELGNLADKRPFFAMKLVKGSTLADLLRETSAVSELPRFLSIFEAICQTVAYAHARGVIHRDLKPTNVMVGSFGEVQVMDWGLAKVLARAGETQSPSTRASETVVATARSTGDSDLSQAGSVLGTPAYMAPEQARGELESVDRRSDVFALGSILCEILTGQPAYVGGSLREILDLASRGDTVAALARLESCGADGELIALAQNCLAGDAKDRPVDARVVAERLTSHLAGVQARLRHAELSRAAESARAFEAEAKALAERRARRLVAALAATILIGAGLGAAGWRWVELERLERIQAAGERVNLALREATRLRALAQGAPVGDLGPWELAAAAAAKARDLLEPGIEPGLRKQVAELATETVSGRRHAESAALAAGRDRALIATLVDIRSAEADDRGGFATDSAYASAFREAGLDLSALPVEEAAKKILARPPEMAILLATALDDWAAIRRDRKKDHAGATTLSAMAATADPDPWRLGLRRALDLPEKDARLAELRQLARGATFDTLGPISLDLLGRALRDAGDPAGAEAVLRQAQQRHPGDVWINYDLARSLEKLARRDEAIRYATAARSLRPETAHELAHMLGDRGEQDEELAVLEDLKRLRPANGRHLGCLGRALRDMGRKTEAVAVLASAETASREALKLRRDDAYNHQLLAFALDLQEKDDDAMVEYQAAIALQPEMDISRGNVSTILAKRGQVDEGFAQIQAAIAIRPDYANHQVALGDMLRYYKGKQRAAMGAYRDAVRIQPDLAIAHARLGESYQRLMMLDEAVAEYRIAARLQPNSANVAQVHFALGRSLDQLGRLDESIDEYRAAIALKPNLTNAKNNLAWTSTKKTVLSAPERAELLQRAREAVELAPKDGNVFNTLALAEYRSEHWDASIAAAERSTALIQGLDSFDWFAASERSIAQLNAVDPSNWFFLAMAHWQRKEKEQARSYFAQAVNWTKKKDPANAELLQFWRESAELLGEPGPGIAAPGRTDSLTAP
jgi:eukaryotic-like serine/threonine-protein kinase